VKIIDRYASATRATNLKGEADTVRAVDVLGAAGLAAKHSPLAMGLLRLFVGDNKGAAELVGLMGQMLVGKAWHGDKIALSPVEACDMARAVLAWHRDGVCRVCGGHGFELIANTPALSDKQCPACRGTGRVLFDRQFGMERLTLARWLLAEVEREMAKAGPAAMAALAPRLD